MMVCDMFVGVYNSCLRLAVEMMMMRIMKRGRLIIMVGGDYDLQ